MCMFWIAIREESAFQVRTSGVGKKEIYKICQKEQCSWERRKGWSEHRAHKWDFMCGKPLRVPEQSDTIV